MRRNAETLYENRPRSLCHILFSKVSILPRHGVQSFVECSVTQPQCLIFLRLEVGGSQVSLLKDYCMLRYDAVLLGKCVATSLRVFFLSSLYPLNLLGTHFSERFAPICQFTRR